jgi:membrane-bound metal-dependent hydrolase YbcI (DUF457 family)
MQGVNHCASGVAVGFATAPLLGMHSLATALPYALIVGGFALANDLDCDHAKASLALGPISQFLSWILRHLSAISFKLTAGPRDKPSAGTHRHLTHTLAFAAVAGALARWTGHLSLWGAGAWLVFGAVSASAALTLKSDGPPPKRTARTMLGLFLVTLFAAPLLGGVVSTTPEEALVAGLTGAQHWLGIAVFLGCLTHLVGDAMTVSGVPAFWPLHLRKGQAWFCVHLLPYRIRLHTGKRFEQFVVHPLFIGAIVGTAYVLM